MKPRIIASIKARMGSSRFPGKVLADICGKPAMTRLVNRLRLAKRLDGIVLATTTAPADNALEAWARDYGLPCYRGSEEDVLKRVVAAQRMMKSDIIVEMTGDCVLLDPGVVDLGVRTFLENDCDVVSAGRVTSFPIGVDVQVFRFKDLEKIEREIFDPSVREHVSIYFFEHPELYRTVNLFAHPRWEDLTCRFVLDYPEDYVFIKEVYSRLEPKYGDTFGLEEIMNLLRINPELAEINRHCVEKPPR